jgi:predicted outer membrane repeat protein
MGSGGYILISNCLFVSCQSSGDGAGVYLSYATATIIDTNFTGNQAGLNGGGLALYCDPAELQFTCVYYLNRTDFSNNTAGAGGGAIKYDKIKPVYTNVTYSNNTALYGDRLAAFPVELRYMQGLTSIPAPVLKGESGNALTEPINVGLYDELNQLVRSASTETEGTHGSLATSNKTTLVSGLQTVQVAAGICSFAGLSVTDAPGVLVNLELTSDAIDYNHANPNTDILSTHLDVKLLLRSCYVGEIIKNSVCDICVSGTYSFNTSDTVCKSCPAGLTCHGGSNTTVSQDYWRPLNTSELLIECYAKDICLGGNLAECDTGYGGRLCTFCEDGYFRFGNFFCLPCGNTVWGIFRGILVILGTAVFLIIMILGNLRNTAKKRSSMSIHFRIFLNYNQVTMLMSSFQIKWPVDLISFFEGLKMTGSATQFAFSNECITGETSINYIYQKVLLVALIPVILIVIAVIIWGIVCLIKGSFEYLRVHVICSIIVLLLSMQPMVLQSSLQMFPCVEVEAGSLWLLHDMHIACWEGEHQVYAFAVALPAIVIWCIGTPLLFWMLLFRQRKNLNEQLNVRRIGFLYSGYHPYFYYWEFVVVLRKSLMVIVANLMVTTQSKIQSQVAITVLWFFAILQYKEMPFETRRYNRTEFLSLFASLVTVISGALYLSDLRTQPGAYYALLIIVFSANSLFMFLWVVFFAVYLMHGRSKKVANVGTWLDKVADKYWRV